MIAVAAYNIYLIWNELPADLHTKGVIFLFIKKEIEIRKYAVRI